MAIIIISERITQTRSLSAALKRNSAVLLRKSGRLASQYAEMVRGYDGTYRLDHAVTATQKTILQAFGISENYVKKAAKTISEELAAVAG